MRAEATEAVAPIHVAATASVLEQVRRCGESWGFFDMPVAIGQRVLLHRPNAVAAPIEVEVIALGPWRSPEGRGHEATFRQVSGPLVGA